jgi:hypothetical protein
VLSTPGMEIATEIVGIASMACAIIARLGLGLMDGYVRLVLLGVLIVIRTYAIRAIVHTR